VLRVGLTGGIGSGKSTVAARFAELGAVVIDADAIARDVVAAGTAGLAAVVAEFGEAVLGDGGALDRAALGEIVFADDAQRDALNAIVHPLVYARRGELVDAAPADAIVVEDIPLLVENRLGAAYHLVVVVHAPARDRVRRLIASRDMGVDDVWSRIRAQASDDDRRAAADVWLDNSGDVEGTLAAVDELWTDRLVLFEANVRTRTRVRGAATPTLVPYDPSWPDQAGRLVARVRMAAGARGLRVDHIGSTSVPGIRAKDVIDLQLTVESLEVADALRVSLEKSGFPRAEGITTDNPHPATDPDPEHWRKRLHGSADPGRVVHLHIRAAGSPGQRYALLFRDWLRAEPTEAAAYEAEKSRIAAESATTGEYAEAKEPWFDAAVPRAEAWAEAAGWSPARGDQPR
jgi:dephospho-CoA kinase